MGPARRCGRPPGRTTARIFSPASRASRTRSATSRTISPLGFSLDTSVAMNSNELGLAGRSSGVHPDAVAADDDLRRPPHPVHGHGAAPAVASTTIAQSISGFSTWTQSPSTRTSVARLVVE